MARSTTIARLEEMMVDDPQSPGCKLLTFGWLQGVGCHRYAYIRIGKEKVRVTRLILDAPEGQVVRHKCDNAACVNPEHLEIGTCKENTQDAVKRGRMAQGESANKSSLKESDVTEIRERYAVFDGGDQRALAKEYGVTQGTVKSIVTGATWPHVGGPRCHGRKRLQHG